MYRNIGMFALGAVVPPVLYGVFYIAAAAFGLGWYHVPLYPFAMIAALLLVILVGSRCVDAFHPWDKHTVALGFIVSAFGIYVALHGLSAHTQLAIVVVAMVWANWTFAQRGRPSRV